MRHTITQKVINQQVGTPQPTDGIAMIFVKAVAVGITFVLDKAYLITKKADLTPMGITAAYDAANSLAVFQQVIEFYDEAADGALLWLVGVDPDTTFKNYIQAAPFSALVRSTALPTPANRAKMLGFCFEVPTVVQTAADFPVEVTELITALQAEQVVEFDLGQIWLAIIDGYNMSSTVTIANLGTMATKDASSISMCITGTAGNGVSAVGAALGRFARISIGHGFGAVEDGPRNVSAAFLTNSIKAIAGGVALVVGSIYTVFGGTVTYNNTTYNPGDEITILAGHIAFTTADTGYLIENATPVENIAPGDINILGDKQFMFLRTVEDNSGFFWNDAATCEDPTFELYTQENNRVAFNLAAAARSFFTKLIGSNLPLDIKTGNVEQTWLNGKQQEFVKLYVEPLSVASGSGDITDGQIVITGVNFNATRRLSYQITIEPTPIMAGADGTITLQGTQNI